MNKVVTITIPLDEVLDWDFQLDERLRDRLIHEARMEAIRKHGDDFRLAADRVLSITISANTHEFVVLFHLDKEEP